MRRKQAFVQIHMSYCHGPNDNTTQHNLNTAVGAHHPTPPRSPAITETQHQPLESPDEHLLTTT